MIRIGNSSLKGIKIGNKDVQKVMVGDTMVWPEDLLTLTMSFSPTTSIPADGRTGINPLYVYADLKDNGVYLDKSEVDKITITYNGDYPDITINPTSITTLTSNGTRRRASFSIPQYFGEDIRTLEFKANYPGEKPKECIGRTTQSIYEDPYDVRFIYCRPVSLYGNPDENSWNYFGCPNLNSTPSSVGEGSYQKVVGFNPPGSNGDSILVDLVGSILPENTELINRGSFPNFVKPKISWMKSSGVNYGETDYPLGGYFVNYPQSTMFNGYKHVAIRMTVYGGFFDNDCIITISCGKATHKLELTNINQSRTGGENNQFGMLQGGTAVWGHY